MFIPLPELKSWGSPGVGKSWGGEVPGEVPGGEQLHGLVVTV